MIKIKNDVLNRVKFKIDLNKYMITTLDNPISVHFPQIWSVT